MTEVEAAVDGLVNLGLTEYEARCFVALMQLPHGTAKEIGQVADIPRSRVYETMDRLHEKGLVELHEAEPRKYQSVSIDTAIELLRKEYESYFGTVEETLDELEPTYKKAEPGVWAINTHDQVSGRIADIVAEANEEVVFIVLDDELFDETVLEHLDDARERGVAVYVGATAGPVLERVGDMDGDVDTFTTDLIDWFAAMSDSPRIGRLLMADRASVLASAIHEEELPGVPNETAAWSDGIDHGFATFVERVLTYELRGDVTATDATGAT